MNARRSVVGLAGWRRRWSTRRFGAWKRRLPWAHLGALVVLLAQVLLPGAARANALAQAVQEEDVVVGGAVVGRHYRQTGGGTGRGYDVRAPFYARLQELGGPSVVGYPVSVPFVGADECLYQDFQVALLQQCPGLPVVLANTFQIMEEAGVDPLLEQKGIGPGEADQSRSFAEAVRIRLGWLEDAAIRDRYLGQCGNGNAEAAVDFCGLPMNHARAFGPFVSQRFQRIAFQRWLTDGPGGIAAGDVTASLGGDLLKETGVLSGPAVQPHPLGTVPPLSTVSFTKGPIGPPAPATAGFSGRATLGIVTTDVQAAPSTAPASFLSGREGQDLSVGDVVRTDARGSALLTYFQGTTSEVLPNSRLVVEQLELAPSGGPIVALQQTAGTVVSRVSQLVLPGSGYQVRSGGAVMVVRGTLVRTTVLPDGTFRVEVFSGIAELTSAGVSVLIYPGQVSEAAPGQPPAPPRQNSAPPPPTGPPATGQAPPATSPDSGPRTQPLSYGFQADLFNTQRRPQAIGLIKDTGFGWAKQQVVWNQFEVAPSACPSATTPNCQVESVNGRMHYFKRDQVGFLDAVVNDVSAAGLSLMISVVRAPAFIAAAGGEAPADPDRLRDFVQFLASRYSGKLKAIEPWNEQNLSWEWGSARLWPNSPAAPPQGVVDFLALQRAAYQGIKAADPGIIVVLPAATPTGVGECWLDPVARTQSFCLDAVKLAIDDRLYLEFLYQINDGEIKNYYDVLGVHPSGFNNPPDDWVDRQSPGAGSQFKGHGSFYIKRYQQLREVQLKYGDTKPMWFTEVGWSATQQLIPGYEYGQDNTEEERGQYFGRLLEQVKNEAPYVTNLFVWNLNFRMLYGPADEKYGFGVVDSGGNPLPAYTCLRDFVRSGERITLPECRPS